MSAEMVPGRRVVLTKGDDRAEGSRPVSSTSERVARVLAEHGASEPGSSHHGWRCEYPDRYGPCTCTAELVAELATVIERLVRAQVAAEIRAEGVCGNGCRHSTDRAARIAEGGERE